MKYELNKYALLSDAIAGSHNDIDSAAGMARSRYITTVAGQEATYLSKAADADRYKAAGYPADTSSYPWVESEMSATGMTAQQSTDGIIVQRDAWNTLGAIIESERIKGKISVSQAVTISEAVQQANITISNLNSL